MRSKQDNVLEWCLEHGNVQKVLGVLLSSAAMYVLCP